MNGAPRAQIPGPLSRVSRGVAFLRTLGRAGVFNSVTPAGLARAVKHLARSKPRPNASAALDLFAAIQPTRPFVADENSHWSYREAVAAIDQFCHTLAAHRVQFGSRVALMMPNSAHYVLLQFAVLKMGGTCVQVGTKLKTSELTHVIENSQPAIFIYAAQHSEAVRNAVDDSTSKPLALTTESLLQIKTGEKRRHFPSGPAGSTIVYTSGTTGRAKGANRSYRTINLRAVGDLVSHVGIHNIDTHLCVCPLYHSAAPAFVAMVIGVGGAIVTLEKFDEHQVLEEIGKRKITSMFLVPTMASRLTRAYRSREKDYDVSSLRWVMSGSAPLPSKTAEEFQQVFGHVLWNFYGATETGLVSLASPSDHSERPGTVGKVLESNEIRIVNKNREDVKPGETGELYVRNPMLISGYYENPTATAESMLDGYFSVGDLARQDPDGYLYIASRVHDMVISGGVNIYPREIEDVLLTHPAVAEAAVIGLPDDEWGESVHAFIVAAKSPEATESALIDHCRKKLANFKQPRSITFVEKLPRNAVGKVLKNHLREMQNAP